MAFRLDNTIKKILNAQAMRLFQRTALVVLLLCSFLWWWSAGQKALWPEPDEIQHVLSQEPVQQNIDPSEPFVFDYGGERYRVTPRARYALWGMVVSHNDISSIADAYHTSASVDFRDLCVVWGQNARPDVYKNATFWSEPFSCHFQFDTRKELSAFRDDQFSNNHLLSRRTAVRKTVMSLNRGDQVALQGFLVDYCYERFPGSGRHTSLTRTDRGNGACETFFLEDARIVKRNRPGWNSLYRVSRRMFWIALMLLPLFWAANAILAQRERRMLLADDLRRGDERRRALAAEVSLESEV